MKLVTNGSFKGKICKTSSVNGCLQRNIGDVLFILQFLREHGVKYHPIMCGAKVLTLSVPICWYRQARKRLLSSFFNRKENENYVAPIPPSPYYYPGGMSPKESDYV